LDDAKYECFTVKNVSADGKSDEHIGAIYIYLSIVIALKQQK